jgi:tRNA 2-selenouridine synthase
MRDNTSDYRALLLSGVPLLDTRAPIEFAKGAFPSSVNHPLMGDEEREQVGICYKKHGQEAAIALGNELVSGELRERRLQSWCTFAKENPQGYLYCFRGGLRSQTAQQWMRDSGREYPLVEGGYKAMRRFLLDELPRCLDQLDITLVAGKTGTGKTRVIQEVENSIDLEGLAKHRGSTFGRLLVEQPAQISFECSIAIELMKFVEDGGTNLLLEDEGRLIGRCALPAELLAAMQKAPMLLVEEAIEDRVQVVVEDYVVDLGQRFEEFHGTLGPQLHQQQLQEDLSKIRKRLGGLLHQHVDQKIQDAFALQSQTGDLSGHREWIEILLLQYYDPMYDYQLNLREGNIRSRGDRREIITLAADALVTNQ